MSAAFKDYYAALGLEREATAEDIKKAFRKMARKHHPDVAKDKKGAEEKFKEINEAHEVLSDAEKRQKYDRLGANWQQEGGAPREGGGGEEFHFGGTGFSDFFEHYFSGGTRHGFPGGGAGGGGAAGRRGSDIEGDLLVTLEEALRGTVRSISLQRVDPRTGRGETETFEVRIPPGATDGRRIRVPGHGEPGRGGAGDLYLRVRHAAHPDFAAQGVDLCHELELAPWEAVLGAEVQVSTLDGPIKLRIPEGAEPGQTRRVRGRGLPRGKSGERGDFLVLLRVQFPRSVSPEERVLWEKLREVSRFQPRASS